MTKWGNRGDKTILICKKHGFIPFYRGCKSNSPQGVRTPLFSWSGCARPLPPQIVKCSGGRPTPTGKVCRVRTRRHKEADRTPRGKRTPGAKRNGPHPNRFKLRTTHPNKKRPGPKSKPSSPSNQSVILRAHPIPMDPSPRCVPITGPK